MRNNFFLVLFFIFILFSSFVVISGYSSNVEYSNLDSKVNFNAKDVFNNQTEVRVIVKLNNDGSDLNFKKVSLADIKKKGYSKLSKAKIMGELDSLNGFSAIITQSDLDGLVLDGNIKTIEVVGTKKLMLQDSVPLINGTITHTLQYNNINLTGKGQTICIIDTGVNYSHPDLGGCYGNNNISSNCKVIGGWDYCADNNLCNSEDNDPLDVEGHGTHVSGIVAANGTINGVAPEAKLVVIKAYSNIHSTFYDDILRKSMDWCINNASRFNISVISMSLGGGLYSSYCDNIDDSAGLTTAINNAAAKNISVVIAAGNGLNNVGPGNYTAIASPACIQNATPVSSVTKSDVIDNSYADRSFMVQLFAPGSSITSTVISGGYEAWSGTSMATPHAAGAFAIVNQYLFLTNRTRTPQQVESLFNSTGKQIYDSSSGLNFSRINVYSAIINLDAYSPDVALVSPQNNILNLSTNISFSCNATDLSLANITFYLWNSLNAVINRTTFNVTGMFNQISINVSNLASDSYSWNCLAGDANGNSAFASSNFTLVIVNLTTVLSSPENSSYSNQANVNFSCTSEGVFNLTNSSFYLWNSTGGLIYNKTSSISGKTNTTIFNYSFSNEGLYFWNCLSVNNYSQSAFANANNSFSYDITSPSIIINSPALSLSSTNVGFNLTLNEQGLCNYSVDSGANNNLSSEGNFSFSNFLILAEGNHNVSYFCYDLAGNMNTSSINFTITSCSGCSCTNSCGGGGGGGGSSVSSSSVSVRYSQLVSGFSKSISLGDKIIFEMKDYEYEGYENHTLTLKKLGIPLEVSLASTPTNYSLNLNEEKKINLTSPKYYDLSIKFNGLVNNKANLIIKTINETIVYNLNNTNSGNVIGKNNTNSLDLNNQDKTKSSFFSANLFIFLEIVVVVILVVLFIRFIRGRKEVLSLNKPRQSKILRTRARIR